MAAAITLGIAVASVGVRYIYCIAMANKDRTVAFGFDETMLERAIAVVDARNARNKEMASFYRRASVRPWIRLPREPLD